jgi:hypothetical protein
MRIKKHQNNEYVRAGNVWVRNFTKPYSKATAINSMIDRSDHQIIMQNESINSRSGNRSISEEKNLNFKKMVIISDGFNFSERHKELLEMPDDVFVIAVNGALRKWELMRSTRTRAINAYVVNNPYPECLYNMPSRDSRYYPICISSTRTYHDFVKKYAGNIFLYEPTPEQNFGTKRRPEQYYIDDYRNPICAAIGLAYQFGVKKLLLMCCDNTFKEKRDAAEQLDNGLWTYPQHIRSHDITDANLYWLTHDIQDEVLVADYSNGLKYKNATYISCKDEALAFFEEESKEDLDNEQTTVTTRV